MDWYMILLIAIFAVLFIFSIIGTIICIHIVKIHKQTKINILEEKENMSKAISKEFSYQSPEYSDKVLEFSRKFAAQTSVLKFNAFINNHDSEKVTRSQIKNLISDTATNINISMIYDNIDFSRTLFSKDFLVKFIINTTIISIKELLDKQLVDIID